MAEMIEHAAEASAFLKALANEQRLCILCTLLDESAASTPWGGSGAWSSQSLLVQFHNEGWGGEKVFVLLARLHLVHGDDQQAHLGVPSNHGGQVQSGVPPRPAVSHLRRKCCGRTLCGKRGGDVSCPPPDHGVVQCGPPIRQGGHTEPSGH